MHLILDITSGGIFSIPRTQRTLKLTNGDARNVGRGLFFNDDMDRIVKRIGNGGPHDCVLYKRFHNFTRHIGLDAHAHCVVSKPSGFGVKSPVPHSAGTPISPAISISRCRIGMARPTAFAEFQPRDRNLEQREELRRGAPWPRRPATTCRQLPHPTEEVPGCRSGDQAVPLQRCGSGACGHCGSPPPQGAELWSRIPHRLG